MVQSFDLFLYVIHISLHHSMN